MSGKAFVDDFDNFSRAAFEDEDTFYFSEGVEQVRLGPNRVFIGNSEDDIIFGGEQWSEIHGGRGSDLLRLGSGGGRLDGGNDTVIGPDGKVEFIGDLLFGVPRGTPGGENVKQIMDVGPDGYANALGGGKTLYIMHDAGRFGYFDQDGNPHPALIKNMDVRNGSAIDFSGEVEVGRAVWGDPETNRDGSVDRDILGFNLVGDRGQLVFVRMDPLKEDVPLTSEDGNSAGFREALDELVFGGGEWEGLIV